jgi:hypothetical protein
MWQHPYPDLEVMEMKITVFGAKATISGCSISAKPFQINNFQRYADNSPHSKRCTVDRKRVNGYRLSRFAKLFDKINLCGQQ